MAEYKLEVTTGDIAHAGTFDHVYVTLIATKGESERTELDNFGMDFKAGKTRTYTVKTSVPLGQLLLVKLEKDPCLRLPENEWFCSQIVVTTPEDGVVLFPCHRWVRRGELVELRGGRAMKAFEDEHTRLIDHRKKELALRNQLYQWSTFADGLPHISSFNDDSEMPAEIRLSASNALEFVYSKQTSLAELKLRGLKDSTEQWKNIEAMKKLFWYWKTPISEYVSEHWKEDEFYGCQFLNGANPNVIQRCSKLPANFPVTEAMVQPFLENGSSLEMEMEKGNIFLCDYKRMEGLPTLVFNGEPLPLIAGMCLFYMNPGNKLLPIAIQLNQQPSVHNPIFLPSDPENDWLLAKMFLRHADTLQYQIVYHLMNTHFLADVFTVATLRSFPVIHPLYKLLIPHSLYTLQINTAVRQRLVSPGGVLTKGSLGAEGLTELMRRALSETTYSSLCLPDNIAARGLESVPNFYYRDDGLRLWNNINSFVQGMVEYYYPSDSEVHRDCELQEWIKEIFTHGFLGNKRSGIPACFHTVEEVIKFITMVIFTVSAQHAAVSNGQFDYNSWVPNSPPLLCKAPPTTKGQSSMKTILETLPDIGTTAQFMATGWLHSKKYKDFMLLGTNPDKHFDEPGPKQMIKEFQAELSYLSEDIAQRNSMLEVPYNYLNPTEIESSVSI